MSRHRFNSVQPIDHSSAGRVITGGADRQSAGFIAGLASGAGVYSAGFGNCVGAGGATMGLGGLR